MDAQTTSIPDNNFEQGLIDLAIDSDGTINGTVLTADISGITNLDLSLPSTGLPNSIVDLTGIEDFVALEILNVQNNAIDGSVTPLDLSQNTALIELNTNSNSIVTLDLSSNTLLEVLDVGNSSLTTLDITQNVALRILTVNTNTNLASTLDVTNNTALIELNCSSMNLTSLDVTNNVLLEVLSAGLNNLPAINVTNNVNLKTLAIATNTNISSIDISQNLNLEILKVNNLNLNTIDVTSYASLIEMNIASNNISTLDVTQNTLLNTLICHENPINSLDLSQNSILIGLSIGQTNMTSIDLSNNTLLGSLDINQSSITPLDLTNNTALTVLVANSTTLGDLDLSNNSALRRLQVANAGLTSLDVSNGNNINVTEFFAVSNPSLICITVDDVAYATTNFTIVDAGVAFSLNCTAREAALTEILEDSNSTGGANNVNATPVTVTQLMAIDGLTGIVPANEAGYQETIAAETGFSNLPTVAEVQAIIDEVNAVVTIVTNSNDPADGNPSITDLTNVGIISAILANEAAYEVVIANEVPAPDTLAELQAVIDNVNLTLSVEDFNIDTILIYPNPSNSIITVKGLSDFRAITIYDLLGKEILESNTATINISNFKAGMYLLKIETDQAKSIKRFIVK